MKDPLQTEQTPYEILGLERGASSADIDNAFKMGLVKPGRNVQKLTAAKLTLQRPAEKALLDLFQYDHEALRRLTPNPIEHPEALSLSNRAATAAAWENALRASFPDPGIGHCLAVLYYWHARQRAEPRPQVMAAAAGAHAAPQTPAVPAAMQQLWQRTIACWAMLTNTDEFWETQGLPSSLAAEMRSAVVERLRNNLHDSAQQYRSEGAAAEAGICQELELALTIEARTAKDVAASGMKTSRGRICCGPLMLSWMGVLDSVRNQVNQALRVNPSNERLRSLRDTLSPWARITVLIDQKKPQAALDAIEALPAKERASQEVVVLHVQALREMGKQAASLGRYEEALDHWALALAGADQLSVSSEIREELVSTCQSRAAAIQSQKRDEAIALLDKGLAIVDDEKLRLTLGELLTTRGIEIFMDAQKTAEREKRGATREILAQFERGLADLDRAAKLGSKRGAEQAALARKLVEQLKSGFLDIPERAQQLMAAANDAAGRDDWDTATNSLREAIKVAGSKAPAEMKKNLAVCLSNRAVGKANRAVEKISQASQGRDRLLQQLFSQLSENSYVDGCALCKKARYNYGNDSWYTMKLPSGGTATLCTSCVAVVRSATENMPGPPAEAVFLLQSALDDLDDAGRLDPSNEAVRKHKSDISEVLSKIGGAAASRPSSGQQAVPRLGGKAAASATDERGILHSLLVGALAAYVFVAFLFATPGGSAWMVRQKQWLNAVRGFSAAGKFAYGLLWPLGIFEFVCLITAYAYAVPFAYLAGVICATSWRKKDGFAKLFEVALWVFFFVATYALIVYMRRPQ